MYFKMSGEKCPARDQVSHIAESQRSAYPRNEKHAENKSRVPNAIDDERLIRRVTRRLPMKIKSDQQIRTQPHAFPAHEQQHIVIRQNQREHREHEEIEIPEEAVVTALMRHVSGRVNVDQHPDPSHKQQPDAGERVEQKSSVSAERCGSTVLSNVIRVARVGAEPGVNDLFVRLMIVRRSPSRILPNRATSHQKRKHNRSHTDRTHRRFLQPDAQKRT